MDLPLKKANIDKPLPQRWLSRLGWSVAIGLAVAAFIAGVGPGQFLVGWLAASVLLVPACYGLLAAWDWGGRDRALAWMMVLAFGVRLFLGVGLSLALPVWGYDEPVQKAGYLFQDAYERDLRAWDLAKSGQPLWVSFQDDMKTDQYGGLLALSAWVYRYLSPDAHRPFLVLVLGAIFAALGVPFLRQAVRLRWSERTAAVAAWIYILYPDAVFFASSQMREPFVVGLSAVAFWAMLSLNRSRPFSWVALATSLLSMAVFSSRIALMVAGLLAILFLLDRMVGHADKQRQMWGWAALAVGAALVLAFSWSWFRSASRLDIVVTQQDVGRLDSAIDELAKKVGEWVAMPVIIVYGLAQPVFPAAAMAVFNPKVAVFWKAVSLVRSVGWYALAPFLLYGLFSVWREPRPLQRRLLVGIALSVLLWLVIASARGGGDLTDNPRYRTLLIVWLALLAGWALDWALTRRDAWLWRWLAVEVIFLGFFTQWYISRTYKIWGRLNFWQMVVVILLLSVFVFFGGWLWDRKRVRKSA